LWSGLAGGVIAAIVLSVVPVVAGNGDALLLGAANRAGRSTWLTSRGPSVLKLNNTGGNPPLDLRTRDGAAPLAVDSNTRVDNLNADRVDGKHASELAVPSGAVMFFHAVTCPSGWSPYDAARGRMVVGLKTDGTLGGTVADPLTDLGLPPTGWAGSHNHRWSAYDGINQKWHSYNSSGNGTVMVDWGDGIGGEGTGKYPIEPPEGDKTDGYWHYYYTFNSADHRHGVEVPYVQLLACKKD
jgi:hypothetical protein